MNAQSRRKWHLAIANWYNKHPKNNAPAVFAEAFRRMRLNAPHPHGSKCSCSQCREMP